MLARVGVQSSGTREKTKRVGDVGETGGCEKTTTEKTNILVFVSYEGWIRSSARRRNGPHGLQKRGKRNALKTESPPKKHARSTIQKTSSKENFLPSSKNRQCTIASFFVVPVMDSTGREKALNRRTTPIGRKGNEMPRQKKSVKGPS